MPHVSIYVDESGDVGFNEKSSKFFTVGYVFTINRLPTKESKKIRRLLKNINFGIKKHNRKIPEFKFTSNTEKTRKRFLRQIKKLDVNIGVICISKDSVKQHLKEDSSLFYRYVVIESIISILVNDYMKTYDDYNSIRFVIDRSLSDNAIKSFNDYCEEKMSFKAHKRDKEMEVRSTILHEDSHVIPMLQVADYIASSTQRKFTLGDPTYYNIISDKIKHHTKWDWNDKINW